MPIGLSIFFRYLILKKIVGQYLFPIILNIYNSLIPDHFITSLNVAFLLHIDTNKVDRNRFLC
jgi:hypothetical protein